jgi:hypothetical protein
MRTTRIQRPDLLEGEASGDLQGIGRWRLQRAQAGTLVRYDWCVNLDKSWMRALLPVLRPVFEWNHDGLMRAGCEGLSRYLAHPTPNRGDC